VHLRRLQEKLAADPTATFSLNLFIDKKGTVKNSNKATSVLKNKAVSNFQIKRNFRRCLVIGTTFLQSHVMAPTYNSQRRHSYSGARLFSEMLLIGKKSFDCVKTTLTFRIFCLLSKAL
jgi:hypothetical protein